MQQAHRCFHRDAHHMHLDIYINVLFITMRGISTGELCCWSLRSLISIVAASGSIPCIEPGTGSIIIYNMCAAAATERPAAYILLRACAQDRHILRWMNFFLCLCIEQRASRPPHHGFVFSISSLWTVYARRPPAGSCLNIKWNSWATDAKSDFRINSDGR